MRRQFPLVRHLPWSPRRSHQSVSRRSLVTGQVVLSWTSVPGVTGYYPPFQTGPDSGDETNLVVGNYSGTSFTNSGLVNGTTYYYVVASNQQPNGLQALTRLKRAPHQTSTSSSLRDAHSFGGAMVPRTSGTSVARTIGKPMGSQPSITAIRSRSTIPARTLFR